VTDSTDTTKTTTTKSLHLGKRVTSEAGECVFNCGEAQPDVVTAAKTATGLIRTDRGSVQLVEKVGERGRNRTFNLLIKSQLLCQLSYAPGTAFMRVLTSCGFSKRPSVHLTCPYSGHDVVAVKHCARFVPANLIATFSGAPLVTRLRTALRRRSCRRSPWYLCQL
jgi:hypothetical protein